MFRKWLILTAVTVAFGLPAAERLTAGVQQPPVRGIYREGTRTGVKVSVFATDGKSRRRVSTDHEFRSGDAFELEMETNQRTYIYVVSRTLSGDPGTLATKSIERIRDDDRRERPKASAYSLLYPTKNDPKIVDPNKAFTLAGFRMDEKPGVEKMFILVSAKPIDITRYFDVNGEQRTGRGASGGRREDTDDDVLDQLNKDLLEWSHNADSALPKSLERDADAYGVVRDPGKPGVVELTLLHFPARRR